MGNGARWTFQPADPEAFACSERRVFLVGMEPNGENYPPDQPKDMGHYFRVGLGTRGFGNLKFLRASLLQLEGVLRPLADASWPPIWWEDLALVRPLLAHLLYLDLKPTEGGGRSGASSADKKRRVRRYVEVNPKKVVSHWMRWKPSYVVLQGNDVQEVFENLIARRLRECRIAVQRVGVPHPSANGYHQTGVATMRENLRPLNEPIRVWRPGGWGGL